MDFLATCAEQAGGAYVHLRIQLIPFEGQSSLRSDNPSKAKSITTSTPKLRLPIVYFSL
ncbi:hypothetical protein [Selenomonas sp.]|uniref:hypothetical protein n=1 Tax=Selenomonas sp. TaxID=2053611 RepID=UPI0025FA885E|nr:hypothetical protein [Selenomonas sp.]